MGLAAVAVGDTLYAIGGGHDTGKPDDVLATVEAFTPGVGWTTKAPMPAPRTNPFGAAHDGLIYVAGGNAPFGQPVDYQETNTLFVYSPASNTWKRLAPMPVGRSQGSAAEFINGRLHIVGGWTIRNPALPHSDLFIYDPVSDHWNAPPAALYQR
jgi:N-acetylneuraminic acid mutarotase